MTWYDKLFFTSLALSCVGSIGIIIAFTALIRK